METGQRVVAGRYRLLAPLGAGGMGTVWRAEDLVLGRTVAVKEVSFPHGLSDEDRDVLRERTRREARAAARLDHPSAVTVYDVIEVDGTPYLVMELVEARTLSQVVRADGPLSPQRTAQVGLALVGALEAAHQQGIVHRDVKPGNVLLGDDGRVVLTDFGIASSAGDSSITSTGLLLGSPSYIAPERARGQAPAPASDLWSLGATLFTAVEGKPPFDAGEPLLTVTAVVTGEHEPFVNAGPLTDVLEGLLERDPARRLGAEAARRELEKVAAATDPAATTVLQVPPGLAASTPKPPAERTAALEVRDVRAATGGPAGGASGDASPTRSAAPAEPGWSRPPRIVRQRRSRTPWVIATLLVAVAAAVVAVVIATDPARNGLGDLSALVPGVDKTAEPEQSAEPAEPPTPDGWTRYVDQAEGWSVAVPPGYVQTEHRGQVQFKDPETRRTLRVGHDPSPGDSPLQDWQRFSGQLAAALKQYTELRLEETEQNGLPAADLEFTYFDQTDLHVLDRRVHAEDGSQAWSLYWQVPEPGFTQSLPVFEQVTESFAPGD